MTRRNLKGTATSAQLHLREEFRPEGRIKGQHLPDSPSTTFPRRGTGSRDPSTALWSYGLTKLQRAREAREVILASGGRSCTYRSQDALLAISRRRVHRHGGDQGSLPTARIFDGDLFLSNSSLAHTKATTRGGYIEGGNTRWTESPADGAGASA